MNLSHHGDDDVAEMTFPASDPPASGQGTIGGTAPVDPASADGHQPLTAGSDRMAVLGLPDWSAYLDSLPGFAADGRASALLVRDEPVRVLLSALNARAEIGSNGAEESLLVHVLRGAVLIERDGQREIVKEQELAGIPAGGGWCIRAERDGTIVLSTFWKPAGRDSASA
jgi:hypothetical protein